LLYCLAWRDVRVRYKQTTLGITWAIVQPLLTMLIFALLFGKLAGIPSDGVPYPLFAYAGLVLWTFFANAVTSSGNSLVGSAHLITKVYFPRMVIPGAAIAATLIDLGIAFAFLIGLIAYYRTPVTWAVAMLPALVMLTILLAAGVGLWIAALNVRYRDVRYALPFLIQLWMFATPIIYPVSYVPEKWSWVLALNPLTGIVEGFRASLFGLGLNWTTLFFSTAFTLLLVVCSGYQFRRAEKSFADMI
jgi:lipopolysaccharide transport system permease protein